MKRRLLKNNKGMAMAYTVIMVTVIFALCTLIAVTIMLRAKNARANRRLFENRTLFDALGSAFYGNVLSEGAVPLDVDGWYLYKTDDSFFEMVREAEAEYFIILSQTENTHTMTVRNISKKTVLTVRLTKIDDGLNVDAWVYGEPK